MVKRFSLLVFFRYFVIYQLVIVGLGVIGFLLSGQIGYLLAALMIFLIICLLQWIKLESTFIIVFSNQIIYRHQNSIINYLGKKWEFATWILVIMRIISLLMLVKLFLNLII